MQLQSGGLWIFWKQNDVISKVGGTRNRSLLIKDRSDSTRTLDFCKKCCHNCAKLKFCTQQRNFAILWHNSLVTNCNNSASLSPAKEAWVFPQRAAIFEMGLPKAKHQKTHLTHQVDGPWSKFPTAQLRGVLQTHGSGPVKNGHHKTGDEARFYFCKNENQLPRIYNL